MNQAFKKYPIVLKLPRSIKYYERNNFILNLEIGLKTSKNIEN